MAWYGRPAVAYAIYLPAAAAGLLLPHLLAPPRPGGATPLGRSLGTALLFALICSGLTSVGMHSSFFYAIWAAGAAASAALLGVGASAAAGWGGAAALAAIYAAPVAVALPSAVTFMAHVMEKVGLAGAAPGTLGVLAADATVGAVAGATLVVAFGTLTPLLAAALGRRRAAALAAAALALSCGTAAWASRRHALPYSREHPKRLLVQHIHRQGPGGGRVQAGQLCFGPCLVFVPRAATRLVLVSRHVLSHSVHDRLPTAPAPARAPAFDMPCVAVAPMGL